MPRIIPTPVIIAGEVIVGDIESAFLLFGPFETLGASDAVCQVEGWRYLRIHKVDAFVQREVQKRLAARKADGDALLGLVIGIRCRLRPARVLGFPRAVRRH